MPKPKPSASLLGLRRGFRTAVDPVNQQFLDTLVPSTLRMPTRTFGVSLST